MRILGRRRRRSALSVLHLFGARAEKRRKKRLSVENTRERARTHTLGLFRFENHILELIRSARAPLPLNWVCHQILLPLESHAAARAHIYY